MPEKINPYGQHYRAVQRLLRNSIQNDIFMYLLDEHLCLLRKGIASPVIVTTTSIIAEGAGVNRGIVAPNIKKLEELGLVIKQGKAYYVCVNYLDSVVTLFNSMSTLEEKQRVGAAFRDNDRQLLSQLGLKPTTKGNEHLLGLRGSILSTSEQNCSHIDKTPSEEMSTCRQSCSHIDKISDPNSNLSTCEQKCLDVDKTAHISTKLLTFEHYCSNIRAVFPTKSDFLCLFLGVLSTSEQKEEAITVADLIYATEISDSSLSDLEKMSTCNHFILSTCRQSCSDVSNRNKEEENKKEEYNERSEALVDIGGMGEEDSDEEIAERSKKRRQRKEANLPKEVQLRRKRENLQKFSEEEVDEIIEDLNNCLGSPAKIFINRFWNYMAVDFSQPENEEDDDEELSAVDITGEAIPASFIKRYMESAYEDTLSLLKEKRLSPDDEELSVVDAEFTPEDVQLIMGWEQYRSKGAEYFTATKTEFYNPQQSLEEEPKANCRSRRSNSEDNSEREDDFQYVQKINILGDTDEGFDQLTPIEAFIYYFCQDCLIQDESHRISDRQRAQLCVKGEDDVRRGLLEQGLKLEDFSDICCTSVPRDLKETDLRPRMFSADKIRRANKKHGFTSVIDEKKLEDLLK
jgi:hypothetical protein